MPSYHCRRSAANPVAGPRPPPNRAGALTSAPRPALLKRRLSSVERTTLLEPPARRGTTVCRARSALSCRRWAACRWTPAALLGIVNLALPTYCGLAYSVNPCQLTIPGVNPPSRRQPASTPPQKARHHDNPNLEKAPALLLLHHSGRRQYRPPCRPIRPKRNSPPDCAGARLTQPAHPQTPRHPPAALPPPAAARRGR